MPTRTLQPRIVQQLDTANQFNRRVTGHDGVIVVCVRRAKQRDQAVATFLADDAAVAANRRAHGNQRRLQPGNRLLGIELRNQIGRTLQIGTENREVLPLARNAVANFGGRRLGGWSGTTAPQAEQNRSPAFRVDEQT